jgi:dihydroorotase
MNLCLWRIVSLFLLTLIAVPAAAEGDLLIRDVTLVSPERDDPIHNVDVLVQDGYIQEVAKHIKSKIGTRILEASGLYLTPGLIDSHIPTTPPV